MDGRWNWVRRFTRSIPGIGRDIRKEFLKWLGIQETKPSPSGFQAYPGSNFSISNEFFMMFYDGGILPSTKKFPVSG